MNISKETYLKLLESLAEQDDLESYESTYIPEESWIPSESRAKEEMMKARARNQGTVDCLKLKKDKIKEAIYKNSNIKVGEFMIKITEYHGLLDKKGVGTDLKMDLSVWQTKYKTPSGNPCKMDYRMDFSKDNRFINRPWLNYFGPGGSAHNMPVEILIDVIKWMQIIQKLTAFL